MAVDYYAGLRSYQIADVLNADAEAWNLYYEPRLGKTRTIGRLLLRWIHDYGHNKFLIVGPLTPLKVTWMRELRAIGFDLPSAGGGEHGYLVPLLDEPSKTQRKAMQNGSGKIGWVAQVIRELIDGAEQGRPCVVLLNDDILRYTGSFGVRGGAKSIADLLCEWAPDVLVRDEADRDSNAGSSRSMALRRISRYTRKRRALTGTPDPNGYINFYSQFCILNPDIFGTNKRRFMERYVITRDIYGREIIGYQNTDELLAKIAAVSSIIRAKDYFDVPEAEDIPRFITLDAGARALYRTLKETSLLETEEFNIDASHQLAKLARLSQIANGYLPVDDPDRDNVAWIHERKIESVVADCSEPLASGQKIIISHQWKPEGLRVAEALRKKFGNRIVHELNGRTTGDRNALVAPFDIDQDVVSDARIMVAQEVTGGVGISFARADHLHFLSWSFDWGDVFQMEKRTWAEGKTRLTKTYHMAEHTVDVYKRSIIQRKENASIMLREIGFKRAAEGDISE